MNASGMLHTVFAASVGVIASASLAQHVSWVPVGADGPFTTSLPNDVGEPTRITLEAGREYRVEFEIRANGWGVPPEHSALGTYQVTLDARGLLGANADPPNPGVDLSQIDEPPYGGFAGAYITSRTCHDIATSASTGRSCDDVEQSCSTDEYCADNPDFVFSGMLQVSAVSTMSANFSYGAVAAPDVCKIDDGRTYYLGTFIFDVPAEAKGIYEFGFDPFVASTFLNNCNGSRISDMTLTPGSVELTTGACCSPSPVEEDRCQSHVARTECDGPLQWYFHGQSCDDPDFACPPSPVTTADAADESAKRKGD